MHCAAELIDCSSSGSMDRGFSHDITLPCAEGHRFERIDVRSLYFSRVPDGEPRPFYRNDRLPRFSGFCLRFEVKKRASPIRRVFSRDTPSTRVFRSSKAHC